MVSKRRPARSIHKPSGEATGLSRQSAEEDAVDGQWQSKLKITRDKAKNPRYSGRAKGRTGGADSAERQVKSRGGTSPPNKALRTGAATRQGSAAAKKARKVSTQGKTGGTSTSKNARAGGVRKPAASRKARPARRKRSSR
jgi:hypothetical protein